MTVFSFITAIGVGGLIGYITNALAIKMLFRPHTAKHIFGFRLPFTPGIIPKEKGRIAKTIGGAISENLMSKEVLEKNLLSDDMIAKIRDAISSFFATQKANPETLRQFLRHYLSEQELQIALNSVNEELTAQVAHKLGDSALGSQIADIVVERVVSKIRLEGLDINLGSLFGLGGLLGKIGKIGSSLWNTIADVLQIPLHSFLSKNINNMLTDKGPEIVNNLLTSEIDAFLNTPMQTLMADRDQQIAQFTDTMVSLYRRLISEQLPKILAAIDIPSIIEGRINEMDMKETETLILAVMDKELQAIIWLGAILGMVMGSINAFM